MVEADWPTSGGLVGDKQQIASVYKYLVCLVLPSCFPLKSCGRTHTTPRVMVSKNIKEDLHLLIASVHAWLETMDRELYALSFED